MKRQFFIIGGIVVFFILLLMGVSLGYQESFNKIIGSWEVEKIFIGGDDQTTSFRKLVFSMSKWRNNLITPVPLDGDYSAYRHGRSTWRYRKKNFFDAEIEVINEMDNIFKGVYEVEILDYRHPQLIRLYSDSVELYLREQYFTLENPTIKLDF